MAKERTRQELLKEIDELRARLEVAEYRKYHHIFVRIECDSIRGEFPQNILHE